MDVLDLSDDDVPLVRRVKQASSGCRKRKSMDALKSTESNCHSGCAKEQSEKRPKKKSFNGQVKLEFSDDDVPIGEKFKCVMDMKPTKSVAISDEKFSQSDEGKENKVDGGEKLSKRKSFSKEGRRGKSIDLDDSTSHEMSTLRDKTDDEEEKKPPRKKSKSSSEKKNEKVKVEDSPLVNEESFEMSFSEPKKNSKSKLSAVKKEETSDANEVGKGKKSKRQKKDVKEEEEDVWKWWEEERKPDGVKWNSLVQKGPMFAPPYVPLPENVKFVYDGKPLKLSVDAEEVASFYARMLDHEYTSKDAFNKNFFKDWRQKMTAAEAAIITDLKKCDFQGMFAYFQQQRELKKEMSKEEKQKIKEEKEKEAKEYGYAVVDGHRQKVANFRIEPPGLFRGRGGHPKMGRLKSRILPEDVIINCSKNSEIPIAPEGHKWREVRHDNTVSWLCCWSENILGSNKYIMLNPSSKVKGEKDFDKFELARRLKTRVESIRETYLSDFKHKEMRIRQRAVALYFIDKLALRAGNEKDVDEAADTVGCCSLRCEHIKLHEELDEQQNVVEFDFLGKDSIRYYNRVPVLPRVFKNLKLFMQNKEPGEDLFDRLDTSYLNQHLQTLMPGLTVKVFRTYNASITLQEQLQQLTPENGTVPEQMLAYNRANRQVAILCNHQRAVPKSHEKSMENLQAKIDAKHAEVKEAKGALKKAENDRDKEKAKKRLERAKEHLKRLKLQRTDKDENKQIALSTSKLNYLDPRISVAWCRRQSVPIEKIFNKTQREKFRWAIEMADEDFVF